MANPLLLLVDDSADLGVIVRAHCRRIGVEVRHALGIEDGWAALREQPPNLLLLDLRLTGEHGTELLRRVRTSSKVASLHVALFTNWMLQEDIEAGLEAGADFVFAKDLVTRPDEWRQRVVEILGWSYGRTWNLLVASNTERTWPTPPVGWVSLCNEALEQVLARRLATNLLPVMLRRAVDHTITRLNRKDDPRGWLRAGGAALNTERLASVADPETAAHLCVSMADQLWCVLGSQDSGMFADVLAPVVPHLKEALLR